MMRSTLQSALSRSALRSTHASTSAYRLVPHLSSRGIAILSSSPSLIRSPLLTSSAICASNLSVSATSIRTSQTRLASTLLRKPDEPEEPEVYRNGEPTIIATDRAINQLKKVAERERNPSLALRVAVEPGGCHGYQYKMEITEDIEEDDFQFEVSPGVSILVDSISLALVRGSTIDYVTELIGSQFAIKNNPQAKGAGCGCGVSWEPVI
ncbi:related to ISA1 - mitochondrial matrix protein involved in biogenesis of the iron-sulfur cluster of Fe/S proteins [Melanopsichium pennsylvanicum]|uniref:Related to ISA1 - mitochondrial matrix protein involved in biogenesis of the iron-sulfur cluster of Fe/S proteins n=2 Tax=Melanopsichium pennsylvanicum TaxID=63383 RepID=A0AAJ5C7A8_9BASI|nr:related to ISA1 - mitochondrial matrix protein involved in biogenesis of the iron-sulfur cluster of Fe/S proteins [Melanopsichium pennsylvanicum]